MSILQTNLLLRPTSSIPSHSTLYPSPSIQVFPARPNRSPTLISCISQIGIDGKPVERKKIRLGLPLGRIEPSTLKFLEDCKFPVKRDHPRNYGPHILKTSDTEVWFQYEKDIVRELLTGYLDLGICGLHTFMEHGEGSEDLIIVHDDLQYGHCRLSLAIPNDGIFKNIISVKELAQMPQWTEERPLRVVTRYPYLAPKFVKENGLKHVSFSTADGELEAAPAMRVADAMLDIVCTGITLKANNLKEIGVVLGSQAILVARRRALTEQKDWLETTHEILEKLEGHFRAVDQSKVTVNMRATSAEEVAARVLSQPTLSGLQGLTISPVFCQRNGKESVDYYAIVIYVPKEKLNKSVQELKTIGGSGLLISPLTYKSDEEIRTQLRAKLGL